MQGPDPHGRGDRRADAADPAGRGEGPLQGHSQGSCHKMLHHLRPGSAEWNR